MSSRTSWSPDHDLPPTEPEVLQEFISSLTASPNPDHAAIGLELEALDGIYPSSIHLDPNGSVPPVGRTRYNLSIPAWEDMDAPVVRLLVTLPSDYPSSAPQLQLLGLYIGAFPIDAGLFGDITRTYITSTGVPHNPGEVCIFDGLVYVQNLVRGWYAARVEEGKAGEVARGKSGTATPAMATPRHSPPPPPPRPVPGISPLPEIFSSEPITDRKSVFIGHAVRISTEADVHPIISHLLQDKKIARAAHPTIWAYRVVRDVGGAAGKIVECDYDDDGETQAGSRLKHLLEILEVENVLVVVSRWFGGIHLGPDRFKHINQSARDALQGAGFLEEIGSKKKGRR